MSFSDENTVNTAECHSKKQYLKHAVIFKNKKVTDVKIYILTEIKLRFKKDSHQLLCQIHDH